MPDDPDTLQPRRSTRNGGVSKGAVPAVPKPKTKPGAKQKKAAARPSPKKKGRQIKSAAFVASDEDEDSRLTPESEEPSSPLPSVPPSPKKSVVPEVPVVSPAPPRSAPTPPAIEVLQPSDSSLSAAHEIRAPKDSDSHAQRIDNSSAGHPHIVGEDDHDVSDGAVHVRSSPSSFAKMHMAMITPGGSPSEPKATRLPQEPLSPLLLSGRRSLSVTSANGDRKPKSMANAPSPHELDFDDLQFTTPPSVKIRRAPLDDGGSPRTVRSAAAAETLTVLEMDTEVDAPPNAKYPVTIQTRLEHEKRDMWTTPPRKIIAKGNHYHDLDAGTTHDAYRSEHYDTMFHDDGRPRAPVIPWPTGGFDITLGESRPSPFTLFKSPSREKGDITAAQHQFLTTLNSSQQWDAIKHLRPQSPRQPHPKIPWVVDPPSPPPQVLKQLPGGPDASSTENGGSAGSPTRAEGFAASVASSDGRAGSPTPTEADIAPTIGGDSRGGSPTPPGRPAAPAIGGGGRTSFLTRPGRGAAPAIGGGGRAGFRVRPGRGAASAIGDGGRAGSLTGPGRPAASAIGDGVRAGSPPGPGRPTASAFGGGNGRAGSPTRPGLPAAFAFRHNGNAGSTTRPACPATSSIGSLHRAVERPAAPPPPADSRAASPITGGDADVQDDGQTFLDDENSGGIATDDPPHQPERIRRLMPREGWPKDTSPGTMAQDEEEEIEELAVIERSKKVDKGKGKARADDDSEAGPSDSKHGRPSGSDNLRLDELAQTIKTQIRELAADLNINYATAVRKIGFGQQEVRSAHMANIHRMVTKQRLIANDERM